MDYLAEIETKEVDLVPLKARHDDDYDLFILTPHVMKKFDNKTAMPRVRNTTLPSPQSFAKRVMSVSNKATRQTVVTGDKLDEKQTAKIEGFIDTAFEMADDVLASKAILRVKPFHNSTAALRGGIASRNLVYKNPKDETTVDILPWDIRDMTWESGENGLLWAANKKKRNKYVAAEKYKFDQLNKKDDVEVTDVWEGGHNEVFVNKDRVYEEDYDLDYTPIMIQPCSLVPMLTLRGTENLWKYWGESIFSGGRDIYSKLNDLATLFMSMAAEGYHPAVQYETEDLDDRQEVPLSGDAAPVLPGRKFQEMPRRDMYQVQLHTWNLLNAELQRATLPYIEYGELAFELSAVAIAKLGEGRDLIFAPIIMALLTGYKQTARMLIDQFMRGSFRGKIGVAGRKINFTPKDLEGDYDIRFDFHSISPEENIANYATAQAAKALNILPNDVILVEILKRSNPAKDKELMLEQTLMDDVPRLRLYKAAHWLADEKRYVEARMVADEAGITLEEITGKQTKQAAKKIKGMPSAEVSQPSAAVSLETEMGRRGLRPREEGIVAE